MLMDESRPFVIEMKRNWPKLRKAERSRTSSKRMRCSSTICALTDIVVDGPFCADVGARVVEGMAGGGRRRDLNVGSI
jgi:hypothetical protein